VRREGRSILFATSSTVVLDDFDVDGREQTTFTSRIRTHPPVLIDLVDIGDVFAFAQLDLVVFGFLVVVLDESA
jgi:hypothetical protein